MRCLECGKNSLEAAAGAKHGQSVRIGDVDVAHSALIAPEAMFGTDTGIVQAGGNRVHGRRLAVVVLQHVTEASVQHARLAKAQGGSMIASVRAAPARLNANQLD